MPAHVQVLFNNPTLSLNSYSRIEQRSKEDASQNKQRKSRRDESSDKSSRSSDSAKGRKESRGMERR